MPTRQEPEVNFVEGLHTVCGAGDPRTRSGVAVHVYLCNASMRDKAFYNSDGDLLVGETFCLLTSDFEVKILIFILFKCRNLDHWW